VALSRPFEVRGRKTVEAPLDRLPVQSVRASARPAAVRAPYHGGTTASCRSPAMERLWSTTFLSTASASRARRTSARGDGLALHRHAGPTGSS
jgi:hypothetical protein